MRGRLVVTPRVARRVARQARAVLEGAFRKRTLSVLCATSTLSAGVNLPARRVLFSAATGWHGGRPLVADAGGDGGAVGGAGGAGSGVSGGDGNEKGFIGLNLYKQMAGRAGRAGMTDAGESVLVVHSAAERRRAEGLLRQPAERLASCFLRWSRSRKGANLPGCPP
eukprot:7380630-Prymnesium_polylepis.4